MSQFEDKTFFGWKKLRWLLLAVIVVAGSTIYFLKKQNQSKASYREFPVKKEDIVISILATGSVQPENRLEIKSPIGGRIDQVLIQEGQKVKKGQILAWMSSTDRAALLDAARAQGADELKKWEELYRATPVMAPLSGMIIRRSIEPGQTITSSEAILVMSDRLTVKAQVDETDLGRIRLNQKAEITLDAYPDIRIPAKVDQIAFEARTVNNVTTYIVDVLPLEAPKEMRSGMTANVVFLIEKKESVLAVSSEAIQLKSGQSVVLIKTEGKEPKEVKVETGATNGKLTEIISGLSEGDIAVRPEVTGQNQSGGKNPFSPMGTRRPPGAGSSRR